MGFRSSNFAPDGPSPQSRVGTIPNGDYVVEITECNFVPVKNMDSLSRESIQYLMDCGDEDAKNGTVGVGDPSINLFTKFRVIEGNHSGYEILNWCLYLHSKPTALRIGREKMAAMGFACGYPDWDSPSELVGKVLMLETQIRSSEQYGDKTNVKRFKQAPPGAAQPTAPAVTVENDDDIPF